MTANWLKDLNLKPRSNSVKTFKSYVDLDPEGVGKSDTTDFSQKSKFKDEVFFITYTLINLLLISLKNF